MRTARVVVVGAAAGALALWACTSRPGTDVGFASDGGADAGAAPDVFAPPDSAVVVFEAGPDVPFEASPPQAFLRVANLAPDAPTAGYDFCVAPHGTAAWVGPVVAATIGDAGTLGDGAAPAVQFPVVTNYAFTLDPGRYDVAVVTPGGGCGAALATATDVPPLSAGEFVTLALFGAAPGDAGGAGPQIELLVDEAVAAGATTGLRFLAAVPSAAAVDFGTGSLATGFAPLVLGAPFAGLATRTPADAGADVDPSGYVPAVLPATVELSCHLAEAGVDLARASNQALAAGAVYTVIVLGGGRAGITPHLLVCALDGVQNESTGLVSACSLVPN